ncbi:SDR family NAD(P)-dependent oxidoreductase [Singulisphaera sp. PoT]|uniref:SDR family NAD(P)-dependent oxidoreductase n=1 Tax=Singulisphaera sp. PoT TaxID=3411797 RepID=UPI003BF5F3D8
MNPFDLSGKVAVVTGGNGGLGLGIARGLAQAGASIAIVARNEAKTLAAAQSLREDLGAKVFTQKADVSVPEQVATAVAAIAQEFGRIDVLVNNAGTSIRKPPHELTLEEWNTVMDVNLTSAFLVSKEAYPHLKSAGGGKVINIGSMGSYFGIPYASAYATSKGGIVQFSKSCALAWALDNIQVNAILPGWFETELTDRARAHVPGLYERMQGRIPQGRWGSPADIAGTAVWLSSAASDYVTGVAIPVDGGFSSAM